MIIGHHVLTDNRTNHVAGGSGGKRKDNGWL